MGSQNNSVGNKDFLNCIFGGAVGELDRKGVSGIEVKLKSLPHRSNVPRVYAFIQVRKKSD
jgi:hypothetical protein